MVTIEFQRAFSPASMYEEDCGICDRAFYLESIWAMLFVNNSCTWLCPGCIERLGRLNPERFPSLEDYEATKRRYPEPIWATDEEAQRVEIEDPSGFEEAVTASYLSRY